MNNKHVVITGASGGIGAAVARAFARQGQRLTLGYNTRPEAAEALAAALQAEHHSEVHCLQVDVSDEGSVAAFFAAAEAKLGETDVLVNAAGHAERCLFTDTSPAAWRHMLEVHATGTFLTCRAVTPAMVRRKSGCIINLSSVWGQTGGSCEVPYSAAKAAVIGLTQALAKELAPSGVRVNCVAPGAIDTSMLDAASRQGLSEEIPLGRPGTPEEAAACVVFLAGEEASYLTGQVLAPNGGWYT